MTERDKSKHWKTALGKPFLSAEDIPAGRDITVTISEALLEFITDPQFKINPDCKKLGSLYIYKGTEYELTEAGWKTKKLVVHFEESELSLIPNVTNCRSITEATDTNKYGAWHGHKIKLYRTEIKVKGKLTPCIRVRGKEGK